MRWSESGRALEKERKKRVIYIYIYIYIDRERERKMTRETGREEEKLQTILSCLLQCDPYKTELEIWSF